MVSQGIGPVALPDEGAQAAKHVADTHRMYVYNKHCAFS